VGGDKDAAASLIRQMFIAPEGHKLVVADYDQIELRVLAHFSNDPTMVRTFHEDLDPHGMTAALILGKNLADITKEDRQVGKTINFATVYGAGPRKVAATIGCSERKAREFLEDYKDRFPKVFEFNRVVVSTARKRRPPHVRTLLGRKRRLPTLFSADEGL
jgi:DNA polymerase-1